MATSFVSSLLPRFVCIELSIVFKAHGRLKGIVLADANPQSVPYLDEWVREMFAKCAHECEEGTVVFMVTMRRRCMVI